MIREKKILDYMTRARSQGLLIFCILILYGICARIRYDTKLTRFYRRLTSKKSSQVAVMATALKMLKLVYWMLRNNEPYHLGLGVVDPIILVK